LANPLRDPRRRLRADITTLGQHSTDLQRSKIQERINSLRSKIAAWASVQELYIPGTATLRAKAVADAPPDAPLPHPCDLDLWLPSTLSRRTECDQHLRQCEWDLRIAQAYDALGDIRDNLRLLTHLWKQKQAFIRGQRPGTRARSIIDNANDKVSAGAAKYRANWVALGRLATYLTDPRLGGAPWLKVLKELKAEDVRGISVGAMGESEGRRHVSWIWMAYTAGVSVDEVAQLGDSEFKVY
jgi:hypothetical protein